MQIITVAIQKGGVAKTTTAAVLAQAAAYRGKRVLAIDLEPQGNLSQALAVRAGDPVANSYNLIMRTQPAERTIVKSGQGMDVIPAGRELSTVTSGRGSARRLQQALAPLEGKYDLVFIDTPAAGELQYNALQASTGVIIPVEPASFNIQSLYMITDVIGLLQRSNPALSLKGILVTKYDRRDRSTLTKLTLQAIQQQAAEMAIPYLGEIRYAIAVQEATSTMQSLYTIAPKSTAAQDYLRVFDTITEEG